MTVIERPTNKLFRGWVIVASFFVIGIVIFGTRFSFGIFFKSIAGEFDLSRATTSAIFSTQMVCGCVTTVLAGWASDKYGPKVIVLLMGLFSGLSLVLTSQTTEAWQLFFTYSLLLSMGNNAMWVVTMSTVARWFDKKRGMALGIASSSSGLGPLITAPLATYLITAFSWRMAYMVMGVIALVVVIPLSLLVKKDPYESGVLPDGAQSTSQDREARANNVQRESLTLKASSKTGSFWRLLFFFFFYSTNFFLITTHLVPHITDRGYTAVAAATAISFFGIGVTAGRLLIGVAIDRIGRKETFISCMLLQLGAMIMLMSLHQLWGFYLFAAVFGFGHGGVGPSSAAVISDTFGLGSMGAIFGVLDVGFGIGAGLGPAIGGLIFDCWASYFNAFLLGIGALLLSVLLVAGVRKETKRQTG